MKVLAYCAASYAEVTRRAAGVEPLCCPPVTADNLNLAEQLEGNDLIFINLHSLPGAHALLGSRLGPPMALRARQLEGLDLGGAVVFSEACYMGDTAHPMRQAFLSAGASAVVAGAGENYGRAGTALYGADLLGLWFRRGLQARLSANAALRLARGRLAWAAVRGDVSAKDARDFQVFRS